MDIFVFVIIQFDFFPRGEISACEIETFVHVCLSTSLAYGVSSKVLTF